MFEKKGISLSPFVFIILAVSLGVIFWSLYNTYFGSKYQEMIFKEFKVDTIRNEIERLKTFLKTSLIYSSHQALREHASSGGVKQPPGTGAVGWICNSPNPPSVGKVKTCLENYTKFFENVYYNNYSITLPLNLNKKKYGNCTYNITKGKVFRGKYDEGNINVLLKKGKVSFSTKNIQIRDLLNLNERIDKNRFWYLYRIFYEWAQKNVYGKGICECTLACKGCSCAEEVAQKALEDLQERFDKYVKCDKTCECCYGCRGNPTPCQVGWATCSKISCDQKEKCFPWKQDVCAWPCNQPCAKPGEVYPGGAVPFKIEKEIETEEGVKEVCCCEKSCSKVENPEEECSLLPQATCNEIGTICPGKCGKSKALMPSEPLEPRGEKPEKTTCKDKTCKVYEENKLSAVYIYTCRDKKYKVPSPTGPEPLIFQVKAWASYVTPDRCLEEVQCECPEGKKKCLPGECVCPPCPGNPCT